MPSTETNSLHSLLIFWREASCRASYQIMEGVAMPG